MQKAARSPFWPEGRRFLRAWDPWGLRRLWRGTYIWGCRGLSPSARASRRRSWWPWLGIMSRAMAQEDARICVRRVVSPLGEDAVGRGMPRGVLGARVGRSVSTWRVRTHAASADSSVVMRQRPSTA